MPGPPNTTKPPAPAALLPRRPAGQVQAALARAPDMTMAHVLEAYLHLLGTEPAGLPVAREAHAPPRAARPCEREAMPRGRGRPAGARPLARGRPRPGGPEHRATRWTLLALQVGHQIDFFTGDSRMLRDRIARRCRLARRLPGYHAVLRHAGLRPGGDRPTTPAPRRWAGAASSWSRATAGASTRWRTCWRCRTGAPTASPGCAEHAGLEQDSFFAVHNWWHLALFHLGLGADRRGAGAARRPDARQRLDAGAGHDRRVGAAVAAAAARRRRRRPLEALADALGAAADGRAPTPSTTCTR